MGAPEGAPAGREGPRPHGPDLAVQYRASREGAVLADRSDLGCLAIRGKDALDLLHRLTTQDIKSLRPGEGAAAVFTTAKGRILDRVTLHRLDDEIFCLTAPGRAAPVRDWIDRYTFREEVKVEDRSAVGGMLGIFGSGAGRAVSRLFGEPAAARPRHHPSRVTVAGAAAILARTDPLGGEGFHLITEAGALPAIRAALLGGAGALIEAGKECLEVLRIEAGLPAAGRELTEEYNPWEARLDDAISLNKGCYVGQEVIARLHTYRKVSKLLIRLELQNGTVPPEGAAIEIAGQAAGTLTSAAAVPGESRVVALGYVRDEDAKAGTKVEVVWDGAPRRPATLQGPVP